MIYVYPTFIAPDMIVIATVETRAMFRRQCFDADASALDETVKHVVDISEYLAILQSSRSIQAGCTGNKSFLSYRKGKIRQSFFISLLASFTNLPQTNWISSPTRTRKEMNSALIQRV